MELYARDTLHREDIRFVAFEPNPTKVCFIEHARMNGFDNPNTFRVLIQKAGLDLWTILSILYNTNNHGSKVSLRSR